MRTDVKKGLSLVAFGYLFTLVNFNLTFTADTTTSAKLNIFPDFVGWILIFFAFDRLGAYVSDKKYLKWGALALACMTVPFWLMDLMPRAGYDLTVLLIAVNIAEAAFWFVFFGPLIRIAYDSNSTRTETLRELRILNLVVWIILILTEIFVNTIPLEIAAMLVVIVGIVALIAAIVMMVALFKLKNEYPETTSE